MTRQDTALNPLEAAEQCRRLLSIPHISPCMITAMASSCIKPPTCSTHRLAAHLAICIRTSALVAHLHLHMSRILISHVAQFTLAQPDSVIPGWYLVAGRAASSDSIIKPFIFAMSTAHIDHVLALQSSLEESGPQLHALQGACY